MIRIENKSTNPCFNLALEEYALKHLDIDDTIIILWQNAPSIIIGRNQNTIEEVNSKYVQEHNINVVRRLSGGGAVYHDLGNINYTFITTRGDDNINNFEKFTRPVIQTLKNLGAPAEFAGRNDITIDGKKFSGNAQYSFRNKLLHHGTILFDSDLSVVQEALNVKADKIQSKGIKSVRSRVTNIKPYLDNSITLEEFQNLLIKTMFSNVAKLTKVYNMTDKDLEEVNKLMNSRYIKWEWNFGESPDFNLQKSKRYQGGNIDIRMDVKDGIIKNCKIFGDFFGQDDIKELSNLLVENKFEESSVLDTINNIDFSKYFHNINKEDFIDCLFY